MDPDCPVDIDTGVATVRPSGGLDYATMAVLRTTLREVTARAGLRQIVVDLSGVSFIDSSVLGLFVATSRTTRTLGIVFRLSRPGPQVMRVLELTNLFDRLVDPSSVDAGGQQWGSRQEHPPGGRDPEAG